MEIRVRKADSVGLERGASLVSERGATVWEWEWGVSTGDGSACARLVGAARVWPGANLPNQAMGRPERLFGFQVALHTLAILQASGWISKPARCSQCERRESPVAE
jgi:hypothetical protein